MEGNGGHCCRGHGLSALILLLALLFSFIIALEKTKWSTHSYEYHSRGWLRECTKWDSHSHRFLASRFEGGVSQILVSEGGDGNVVLEEEVVVDDPETVGNATLGMLVDQRRNRLLVVVADAIGNSYSGIAGYDMTSWDRLFLTHLAGPGDEKSFADDVGVDADGNAYVTDTRGNKIWKIGLMGELIKVIKHPLFSEKKEWYYNLVGLNGVVYHPNGFLLVIHTTLGSLYKIETIKEEELVTKVEVLKGSLIMGDGLELLSPTQVVVAGTPSGRLVESLDGWVTARVVGRYIGPMHRVATSATVKNGKVYLSHLFGGGIPRRKHVITEAVFSPTM